MEFVFEILRMYLFIGALQIMFDFLPRYQMRALKVLVVPYTNSTRKRFSLSRLLVLFKFNVYPYNVHSKSKICITAFRSCYEGSNFYLNICV